MYQGVVCFFLWFCCNLFLRVFGKWRNVLELDWIVQFFICDGWYLCVCWGWFVVLVIFGLVDEMLDIFCDVICVVLVYVCYFIVEIDFEMGVNMMSFFLCDWDELVSVLDLVELIGQFDLFVCLVGYGVSQYCIFWFDVDGGICVCMIFVNMGGVLVDVYFVYLVEGLVMWVMLIFVQDVLFLVELVVLICVVYDLVMLVVGIDFLYVLWFLVCMVVGVV